jgi:hypothetical protein
MAHAATPARLDGRFIVGQTLVSGTNIAPPPASRPYVFTAVCSDGPCPTQLTRTRADGSTVSYTLTPEADGTYGGSTSYTWSCFNTSTGGETVQNGLDYTETITLSPTTTSGGSVTSFTGTLTITFTPNATGMAAGCRGGDGVIQLSGRLGQPPIFTYVPSGPIYVSKTSYIEAFSVTAQDPENGVVHLSYAVPSIPSPPVRVSCSNGTERYSLTCGVYARAALDPRPPLDVVITAADDEGNSAETTVRVGVDPAAPPPSVRELFGGDTLDVRWAPWPDEILPDTKIGDVCTAGFAARSTSIDATYMLTTRHCVGEDNAGVAHREPFNLLTNNTDRSLALLLQCSREVTRCLLPDEGVAQGDMMAFVPDSAAVLGRMRTRAGDATATVSVLGTKSWTSLLKNTEVCHYGAKTGLQCGKINGGQQPSATAVFMNARAAGGDSGGPVFVWANPSRHSDGVYAIGITLECQLTTDGKKCANKGMQFVPIDLVERQLGVRVLAG